MEHVLCLHKNLVIWKKQNRKENVDTKFSKGALVQLRMFGFFDGLQTSIV